MICFFIQDWYNNTEYPQGYLGRQKPLIDVVVLCIATLKIYADFCPVGRMSAEYGYLCPIGRAANINTVSDYGDKCFTWFRLFFLLVSRCLQHIDIP